MKSFMLPVRDCQNVLFAFKTNGFDTEAKFVPRPQIVIVGGVGDMKRLILNLWALSANGLR